ncbi:unnamed protein product [Rotaria sp. Silwood2]|nr:unnamed protein product [Rotaria sp. Silwood2]CAF2983398.1 unnamed protein product [Rotaria sp. Silwood2]CAF3856844.1 unnamed protein product [Rotaria sp. Silwood2]CAF4161760.1 unnamed protein product [Rotaria sp. Silwood2]
MTASSATANVRILPNNKVYRQLFDAQVQLSDTYNRVRDNQLAKPVNITAHPDATPLVRNIRPHEYQKQQWLSGLPFDNDPNINPIAIFFRDEKQRRQNEEQEELEKLKQEVFDLPDNVEREKIENDENNANNVTERLAATRQIKFNQFWNELLDKISELNQNLLNELEGITRECNIFYEHGDNEIDDHLQTMIYQKEITNLTIQSYDRAFEHLDSLLPPRLSKIQDYCQTIEGLEMERIRKIRDLFKYYSERLYKTHHLSDEDTANELEKQANELNTQIIENRKVYTELEARLLTGETDRVHRYRAELIDHQNKWRDAMWIIHKQTWISKLSQCKAKLQPTISSTCEPIGSNISEQTRHFVEHINMINTFVPPISTKENAEKWYKQGYDIVNNIVNQRQELMHQIIQIVENEIDILEKESKTIQDKVLQTQVYNTEQAQMVFERDIKPLFEERKQFLQESVIDQTESVYKRLTNSMYKMVDRLLTFIQTPAEQWDNHQLRLEHITSQLLDMMRECRRPHDIQNEKKLTKLDSTLDEMRSASNETTLSRLLTMAYEQLDTIKASYAQFYDIEHSIVNKYSDMIAEEVNQYKMKMLDYFHAREKPTTNDDDPNVSSSSSSNINRQFYTTSLARITYEIEGITSHESDFTQQVSTAVDDDDDDVPSTEKSSNDEHSRIGSASYNPDQAQTQTFITEDTSSMMETDTIPFYKAFQIPSNLVQSIMSNLCRAFLDYYDQWKEETAQRAEAVMFSKHDELDKEMDFQMHLHEPRRIRIETDIHNVRAAELVMHDERVERHIRGVQETLEQTDADYHRMLNEFSKSILTYKDDIFGLEQVFVNATTSGRLSSLQDRLTKKRDTFMDNIRISLRNFRKRFDDSMQYLRQANVKFRKSFKMFSDGGNFSRDEIEIYRKKLEKTAGQIDKAETAILKEMEKLEKKQLEEATKIMNQFQERFKNHMTDLQFIEISNRWISETQVKIKSEVAANNQQSTTFKKLVLSYRNQIDSILNPNLDKQPSTLGEVREGFQQIILISYERALYLKCLNNELIIPGSLVTTLKNKGLLSEEELVNDLLNASNADETTISRRPSRMSASATSNADEVKSVKFASTSSPGMTSSSRNKTGSASLAGLTGGHAEDINTISTIRTLLHKSEQQESDEIVEPGIPAALGLTTRSIASASSSRSSQTKKSSANLKKRSSSHKGSAAEETTPTIRRDRPSRAKTRDEIYALYCTFGEKQHPGQDFLSKILNTLRETTEGLLTHAEIYYKEKGPRPVTRPQALREKFDEYVQTMIEKLKNYEEQCRVYHEHSINEFREMLELVERTSSLMAKLELDEQIQQAEKVLNDIKQQFDATLDKKLDESNEEKSNNFEQLRPTLGHPSRKNDLEDINNREKLRQDELQKNITQFRSNTIEDIQTNGQATIDAVATNAERLLILFDDILTADEITRTKLPPVKQPLDELIRRQQAGRPLEDVDPTPILERKPGHWPGLPLLDDQLNRRYESSMAGKKRLSAASQRQKTSASIVTQKTTLPQMETVAQRNLAYQKYKGVFSQTLSDIENRCSTIMAELDRHRLHWVASIEKLQQLRTC